MQESIDFWDHFWSFKLMESFVLKVEAQPSIFILTRIYYVRTFERVSW